MKQVLQARNSGLAVVRDVPAPPCPAGGVLVRNSYSVISSGTERARVQLSNKSLLAKARERPDLVREVIRRARRDGLRVTQQAVQRRLSEQTPVGYSSAGVVLEVGEHVRGLVPGDRAACAGGGHANHAEIVAVPRNLCVKVPGSVPLEAAAFGSIGAIAMHGVRLGEVTLGDRVAVVGCGLVGQITCRLLQAAGAEVFALDIDTERVDDALRGGVHHGLPADEGSVEAILQMTGGVGVDCAIVSAGASASEPLVLGAELTRDRGVLVLVGAVPVELPRSLLYEKELVFRVSRSYGPGRYDPEYEERGLDYPIAYVRWSEQRNIEAFLELQGRGQLDLADLIDEIVTVEEAPRAYERLAGGQPPRGALVISYGDRHDAERADAAPRTVAIGPTPPEPSLNGRRRGLGVDRPVRVGLIGPGSFASRVIVPAITAAGASLELVGGGNGPSAEAARRDLGFDRVADSERAVIEDADVDALVICTRHSSHARLVAAALEAGKHVFCEKPLALTTDELEAVLAAARAAPGTLTVGFNRRFSAPLRDLRSFVGAGAGLITAGYRVSAGPLAPDHWVHDLAQGGGRALGEVCHFVDCLRFVVGSDIVEVHTLGCVAADAPIQASDNLIASFRFEDGSIGWVGYVSSGSSRLPKERLEVFRDERTAVLDDYRRLDLFGPRGRQVKRQRGQDKGHREELAAFVQAVRSGVPPVGLPELANVSLATLAIVEALRTASPIRLEA